jgi:aminoglycoside phosphotransferase (APT) family kinase protein
MPTDIKDNPNAAWIESMRQRFPTEEYVDRALTARLKRRGLPSYRAQSVAAVADRLNKYLERRVAKPFLVSDLKQMTGGGSKEQFSFRLQSGIGSQQEKTQRLVLRMQPPASHVENHRLREYQVQRALKGVIPVPEALWVDAEGEEFGQGTLICSFCDGVTRPPQQVAIMTPRMDFGPKYRALLWRQFVKYLAMTHRFDWSKADLSAFAKPSPGTNQGVIQHLNWWERVWEEDSFSPEPLITVASKWLRENAPPIDRVSLIHGDYRGGNFLFDASSGQITAILDWELAWLGDRHADLAYVLDRLYSEPGENGEVLICGLCTREQFFAEYETQSGLSIDPEKVAYYEVMLRWRSVIQSIAGATRCVHLQQTHQDILFSWIIGGVGAPLMRDLHRALQSRL